jgi:hypothetical protein
MKKALIAAAVASAIAAPVAMAADGPKIGLYVPLGINLGDTETNNGLTTTDAESIRSGGGNNINFTWTDTLNNGMTLDAFIQWTINTGGAAGAQNFAGDEINERNSHIGLHGEFGDVYVGTNEHFFEVNALFDGYGNSWNSGGDAVALMQIGRTGFAFTRRDTQSIWWNSKETNGVTLKAAYIFNGGADAGNSANPNGHQMGVDYNSGAFHIKVARAVYEDYDMGGGSIFDSVAGDANIAGSEVTGTSFRAGYDFGNFSVTGIMFDMEQQASAGNVISASGYTMNVTMPTAGGRILFNIGEVGDQDVTTGGVTQALADSGSSGFDIGYAHDLSANTYVFARYESLESGAAFDDQAAAPTEATAFVQAAGATDVDSTTDSILLGVVFSY